MGTSREPTRPDAIRGPSSRAVSKPALGKSSFDITYRPGRLRWSPASHLACWEGAGIVFKHLWSPSTMGLSLAHWFVRAFGCQTPRLAAKSFSYKQTVTLLLSNTNQFISHCLPSPPFPRGCSQTRPGCHGSRISTYQFSLTPKAYLRALPLGHVGHHVYLLFGDHEALLGGRSHLLRGAWEMQKRGKIEAVEKKSSIFLS